MSYLRLTLITILVVILGGCGGTLQTTSQNTPFPTKEAQLHTQGTVFDREQDNAPVTTTIITSPVDSTLTPTIAPTPTEAECSAPPPKVSINVNRTTLQVGETLTVTPTLTGFSLAINASLAVNDEYIAKVGWNNDEASVSGSVANVEVSPNPNTSPPQFLVRALAPGQISLQTSAYGDTGFCIYDETRDKCICSTTHKSLASNKITIKISPADTPNTVTPSS